MKIKTLPLICLLYIQSGTSSELVTGKLPTLITRGTHFEVGYNVGVTFRDSIQAYYSEHPALRPVWLPWSQTPKGQKVVQSFLEVEKSSFPQYITELRGMAAGANVSFIEIFLANHYVELGAMLYNSSGSGRQDSCSDVMVNHPLKGTVLLAHNEDNTPLIQNKAYLLTATVTDQSGSVIHEQFTAYCYPGQLPGNAFGFNRAGLVITVNGLYPKVVESTRVGRVQMNEIEGRSFINRAMLVTSSLQSAVSVAAKSSAYGLSANIGVLQTKSAPARLYNVEVAPNPVGQRSLISVKEVSPQVAMGRTDINTAWYGNGADFHVNMYRRLSVPQVPSHIVSSAHRTKRILQFAPPTSVRDVMGILGDTADAAYPIYRRPRPTDNETTLATAFFDLQRCKLTIYQDNPKTSPGPLVTLPLPSRLL